MPAGVWRTAAADARPPCSTARILVPPARPACRGSYRCGLDRPYTRERAEEGARLALPVVAISPGLPRGGSLLHQSRAAHDVRPEPVRECLGIAGRADDPGARHGRHQLALPRRIGG